MYAHSQYLLLLPILTSCVVMGQRRRPLSMTGQIESGSIKQFLFDPYYKHCKLQSFRGFFIKKFTIEEGKSYDGQAGEMERFVFFAASMSQSFLHKGEEKDVDDMLTGKWLGTATCTEGSIDKVHIADKGQSGLLTAHGCGIATVLTYLCLVDKDVEGDGIGHSIDTIILNSHPKLRSITEMATKHCTKFIQLKIEIDTDDEADAKAFIYAAADAGYNKIAMYHMSKYQESTFDTDGALKEIDKLQKCNIGHYVYIPKYNMNAIVEKVGRHWYFCRMKPGKSTNSTFYCLVLKINLCFNKNVWSQYPTADWAN